MLTPDQQRVKQLLSETITLLCKNGLHFRKEFCINALIGITLDQHDVFLVTINETVYSGDTFIRNHGSAGELPAHALRSGVRSSDIKYVYNDPSARYSQGGDRFGSDKRDFRDRHRGTEHYIDVDSGLGSCAKPNSGDSRLSQMSPRLGGDVAPASRCRSLKSGSTESQTAKRSDSRSSHSDSKSTAGNESKSTCSERIIGEICTPEFGDRKKGDSIKRKEEIGMATLSSDSDKPDCELQGGSSASAAASKCEIESGNLKESKNTTNSDEKSDNESNAVKTSVSEENIAGTRKRDQSPSKDVEEESNVLVKLEKKNKSESSCPGSPERSSNRESSAHSDVVSEAEKREETNLDNTGSWQSIEDMMEGQQADLEDEDVRSDDGEPRKSHHRDAFDSRYSHSDSSKRGVHDLSESKSRFGGMEKYGDSSNGKTARQLLLGGENDERSDKCNVENRMDFYSSRDGQQYTRNSSRDDERQIFVKQEPRAFYPDDYMDNRNTQSYYGRRSPMGQYPSNQAEGFSSDKFQRGISAEHSQRLIGDDSSSPSSLIGGYSRFGGGDGPQGRGGVCERRRDSGYDLGSPHSVAPIAGGNHASGSIAAVAAAAAAAVASPGRGGIYFGGGMGFRDGPRDSKMGIIPGSSNEPYFGGASVLGTPGNGGGMGTYEDALRMSRDSQWSSRRQRATFTSYQIERLESTFNKSRYVGTAERAELSRELNINENIIQVWFQNRRQKLKKQMSSRPGYQGDGFQGDSLPGDMIGKIDFDISSYMAEQLGRPNMGAGGSVGPGAGGYEFQDSGRDDGSRGGEDDSGQEGGLNGGEYSN